MNRPASVLAPILVAAASLVAVGALLYRVTQEPLDAGYVRYLGIADEIVRTGDWIQLRIVDRLYLEKPPLFFWILAVPMALLGSVPNWAPHVPGLLALAVASYSVYRLAREVYGPGEPALAATLLFATTWEAFNQATGKRLDLLFAAWVTAAFASFFLGSGGTRRESARPALLALAWVFVAFAVMTKGPLAILFFLLGVGGFAAWSGRSATLVSRGSFAGIALFVAICAIWPVLLGARLGFEEAFATYAQRSFTTRRAGVFLYLAHLPEQAIPWSVFLPALAVAFLRRRGVRGSDALRFLAAWFLAVFIPLHFSEARHSRYLLPASPALGLLLVSLWYAPLDSTSASPALAIRLRRYGALALFGLVGLAGIAAGIILAALDREPLTGRNLPAEALVASPLSFVLGLAALVGFVSALRRGRAETSLLPAATLVAGVTAVVSLLAAGDLREQDQTGDARAVLASATSAGRPVAMLGLTEEQRQLSRLFTGSAIGSFGDVASLARFATESRESVVLSSPKGRRELEALPGFSIEIRDDFELAQDPIEVLVVRAAP
ncbi:Undecaprenyl phosphate-alpha-4-amino-4-deoxy-L-arabinose arabinosyl transferase [Myxococcaceae bacterium]|nr:Undecaprenyl phosphate-alpha-4-amino-4-deoxy-L-arabinose arabinosyl transferase [Myxococcaceae bacterium]